LTLLSASAAGDLLKLLSSAASSLEVVVGDEVERFPIVHFEEVLIGVGELCVRVALILHSPEEVESVVRIVCSLPGHDVEVCVLLEQLQVALHRVPAYTLANGVVVSFCFALAAAVGQGGTDLHKMSHLVLALWVDASQLRRIASANENEMG
jgi:hypothetical protein